MKRAVNNVPLATVIGLIPGYTKIVVENRLEKDMWNDHAEATERWIGLAMDFRKASDTIRYKWAATKVRRIEQYHGADFQGAIRIIISTEYEKY